MPHIIELFGCSRTVVKNKKVVEVGETKIKWCPLVNKYLGVEELTPEVAKNNVEYRIKDFGLFTADRKLEAEEMVGFGASETLMTALRKGLIDAVVTVCDGAGTVITDNPELVQGIGAKLSGIVDTDPIHEVINRIEEKGGYVLDLPRIDQVEGVRKASELGYKKIAVMVADVEAAKRARELEKELNIEVIIYGVHVTMLSRKEAEEFLQLVDITGACASKHIRELAKPLVQAGTYIPQFALTEKGKELMVERAKEVSSSILMDITTPLPSIQEDKQPRPLWGEILEKRSEKE